MKIIWLTTLLLSLICFNLQARELEGVKMDDSIQERGITLSLIGMGVREVTIAVVDINVYVAGLYLEHKDYIDQRISHNGDDVIHSQGLKIVKQQFKHHVGPSDMRDHWEEGILKNCGSKDKCNAIKDSVAAFKSFMPSVNSGDTMAYVFDDKGVEVQLKGAKIGTVENKAFADAVLSVFIGDHPVTEQLKKGLLAQ